MASREVLGEDLVKSKTLLESFRMSNRSATASKKFTLHRRVNCDATGISNVSASFRSSRCQEKAQVLLLLLQCIIESPKVVTTII